MIIKIDDNFWVKLESITSLVAYPNGTRIIYANGGTSLYQDVAMTSDEVATRLMNAQETVNPNA